MKFINLMTKTIQINPYTPYSSNKIDEKFKDQSGALHSPFFARTR